MEAVKLAPCLAAVPNLGENYQQFFASVIGNLGLAHCNITRTVDGTSGHRLEDGNYTGMLGMAQRQEISAALHVFRPAGLKDDIVEIGPVVFPAELQVFTRSGRGITDSADVLNVAQNIKIDAFVSFVILWYIVITLVAFFADGKKPVLVNLKLKRWTLQALQKLWHFMATLVDQENLTSQVWAIRCVWVSFCITIYVVVFGYVLNLIQTDGVAELPPKKLEYVRDLLHEPEFNDKHLMIFTSFHFYDYLLTSAKGTTGSILYERMRKTDRCSSTSSHCSFLSVRMTDPVSMAETITLVNSDSTRKGLLMDSSFYRLAMQPAGCIFSPETASSAINSRDFVVSDYATMFYSKSIDKHLLKLAKYRSTLAVENGVAFETFAKMIDIVDASLPTEDKFQRFRCMRGINIETLVKLPPSMLGDNYVEHFRKLVLDVGMPWYVHGVMTCTHSSWELRCNITLAEDISSGYKLPDGNYTGMLGMAQRQEISMGVQVFRPASVEDEIVIVGPVILPTGLMVVSSLGQGLKDSDDDILNVFRSLKMEAIVFLGISVYTLITFVAFVSAYERNPTRMLKLKFFVRQYLDKLWHLVMTVVDQENLPSSMWTIKLVWAFCCFAIFAVIFGYLMNLIQTDGVVEQPPKRIEYVHDLVHEPEFQDTHLMIITALHFYGYLLSSPKGSVANVLFERMSRTDKDDTTATLHHTSFLEMQLSNPARSMESFAYMTSDVEIGNRIAKALLVDTSIYDIAVHPAACIVAPDVVLRSLLSKDFVVSDYATVFFSKTVDKDLMRLATSKLTSVMEHGILYQICGAMIKVFEDTILTDDKFKRFRCLHGIPPDDIPVAPPSFELGKLRKASVICGCMIAMSLVVFCFELNMRPPRNSTSRPKTPLVKHYGFGDNYEAIFQQFIVDLGVPWCNVTYFDDMSSGYKLDDGNYTGMLGKAQRQEITMGVHLLRPAGLEGPVVQFGPVALPTGLMVVTSKGVNTKIPDDDLMNVFKSLTLTSVTFMAFSVFIIVTFVAFAATYQQTRKMPPKLKKMIRQWRSAVSNLLMIIVDQENLKTKMWTIRFIWSTCCLAIFIIVFGYLLNLIQTDGVVVQPPKRVEVVRDLTHEPEFQDTHIMMISVLHFYQYLRRSGKETAAGILFDRMSKTDKDGLPANLHHTSFLDMRLSDPVISMESFAFMTSDVAAGKSINKALLIDVSMYDLSIYQTACIIAADVISEDHRSKDFLVADYATMFFSTTADKHFVQLANRKLTGNARTGLD
ncbi:hypothetical protein HDE_11472 [Halotydeus destructor]|nr:hypothetical protein HDE_11472 [Halotydeus destructor]